MLKNKFFQSDMFLNYETQYVYSIELTKLTIEKTEKKSL